MIRLQRAAQLLKQKEYTITKIAEIVGFSDAKYFEAINFQSKVLVQLTGKCFSLFSILL